MAGETNPMGQGNGPVPPSAPAFQTQNPSAYPASGRPAPAQGSYAQGQCAGQQPFGSADPAQTAGWRNPDMTDRPGASAPSAHAAPARTPGLGRTFAAGFAGAALAVALGAGGFATYQAFMPHEPLEGSLTAPAAPSASSSKGATTINVNGKDATLASAVASKALPSIVSIDVYTSGSGSHQGLEAPHSGSDPSSSQLSSLGSGVVLTEDGYIVTNYHVVEGSESLKATINGTEYDAKLVGSDPSSDIAVIKADATGLTPIEIGSSSDLQVGDWVMSLGNPFGLENSVSEGIVSALQRSTTMTDQSTGRPIVYPNMIQTDATINPGNSGGALVDSEGRLVGINSMITSESGSSSGVGFAIPVDYAMNIARQIMNGETPTHAQLGVSMSAIDSSMAGRYGIKEDSGVYVASVYEGTSAAEAGIKEGDVITSFEGKPVSSPEELMIAVRSMYPGDTAEVGLNRDGKDMTVSVTLGSDEMDLSAGESSRGQNGRGNQNGYGGNGYGPNDGYGQNGRRDQGGLLDQLLR